jgi:NMD protein affecting ribosome stability and mRNA decay
MEFQRDKKADLLAELEAKISDIERDVARAESFRAEFAQADPEQITRRERKADLLADVEAKRSDFAQIEPINWEREKEEIEPIRRGEIDPIIRGEGRAKTIDILSNQDKPVNDMVCDRCNKYFSGEYVRCPFCGDKLRKVTL